MIIELCIAGVSIAFIALVIYLIMLINSLRETFSQVDRTLFELRKNLDEIAPQAQKTIEHANQVSFDLKRKMDSLDPLFNTLNNVGEILEHKTYSLKKENVTCSQKEKRHSNLESPAMSHDRHAHVADFLELAGIGIRLWKKLKE